MNTIKRFKAKIDIQHILMMMLIFMLSFSIAIPISTITAYAGIADLAGTSGGSQQASSGSGHPYYKRTGWLVYFCRESTGTLISPVIYVNSGPSLDARGLPLNTDYLLSRVGGQKPSGPTQMKILPNGCPWGTPWTDSGATRYKEVKKYFVQGDTIRPEAKQGLMACGVPADIIDTTLTDDDICLILENCAYYRLNGKYYLASSYGFGKLYSEQPNICNDTNGAPEKFYGLGSVQKCEHFEKDHGKLPSHVDVTGSVSAWTPISAAEAADQTKGWGLSYIGDGGEVPDDDTALGTGVIRESQITRGLPMGGSTDNNTKCTGNRDHNQTLENTEMFGKTQTMKVGSVAKTCGGHPHTYPCGQKHYDANGKEVPCPGNDKSCTVYCSGGPDFLKKEFWFKMNAPTIKNKSEKCVMTNIYSRVKWNLPSWDGVGTKYEKDNTGEIDIESLTEFDTRLIMCRAMDGVTIAKWKTESHPDRKWLKDNAGCHIANTPQGRTLENNDDYDGTGSRCPGDGCSKYKFTLKWNYSTTKRKYGYTTGASCSTHGASYTACTRSAKPGFKDEPIAWFKEAQTHTVIIETYKGEDGREGKEPTKSGIPEYSIDGKKIEIKSDGRLYDGSEYLSDSITTYPKCIIDFYPYIQMRYTTTPGDLNTAKTIYVLGEYKREVQANDCAEIEYKQSMESNMKLSSTQWSTHQAVLANANWKSWRDVVLPGGATFNVSIDSSKCKLVHLKTFQIILEGDGKTQVEKTTGLSGDGAKLVSEDYCIMNHAKYVSSVISGFDMTNMQQWWSGTDVTNASDGWGSASTKYEDTLWANQGSSKAIKVGNESSGNTAKDNGGNIGDAITLNIGDNSGKSLSTDSKYYLSVDTANGLNQSASEGDLDVGIAKKSNMSDTVKVTENDLAKANSDNISSVKDSNIWKNTKVDKYTFYTIPTSIGIYCKKNGTDLTGSALDKAIGTIDARTSLPTNMSLALEQGTGRDEEANWGGGAWYNEAMDGITVMVCDTTIRVGYLSPAERSAVLDTLLTPKNEGGKKLASTTNKKDGLFGNAYYSQISTKDYSELYKHAYPASDEWKDLNSDDKYSSSFNVRSQSLDRKKFAQMGVFHGQPVYVYNLRNMYYTKKFIIPNVTVQDLY